MSVKFEFTLSDQDASNLIDILQGEQARALSKSMKFINARMSKTDQANLDWYNGHAEYLERLKLKVLEGNKRVE